MVHYCCRFIRDPGGFSYKGKRSITCYHLQVSVSLRAILISFIDVNVNINITNNAKHFFHQRAFPYNLKNHPKTYLSLRLDVGRQSQLELFL